jgi:hypothetical protein
VPKVKAGLFPLENWTIPTGCWIVICHRAATLTIRHENDPFRKQIMNWVWVLLMRLRQRYKITSTIVQTPNNPQLGRRTSDRSVVTLRYRASTRYPTGGLATVVDDRVPMMMMTGVNQRPPRWCNRSDGWIIIIIKLSDLIIVTIKLILDPTLSGGSMVTRLKLKEIDRRAPPGVEPAA